jgi:hypothetical protein
LRELSLYNSLSGRPPSNPPGDTPSATLLRVVFEPNSIYYLAQSLRRVTYILLAVSVLLFLSAVASVVFLQHMGMYVALGLTVGGSFTMLLTTLLRERLSQISHSRALRQREPEYETESTIA